MNAVAIRKAPFKGPRCPITRLPNGRVRIQGRIVAAKRVSKIHRGKNEGNTQP